MKLQFLEENYQNTRYIFLHVTISLYLNEPICHYHDYTDNVEVIFHRK